MKAGRRNKKVKGWKEKGIKKERRTEMKKEVRGKGGKGKKNSSAGFKPVRLVLLVVLSVEREGWLEGLVLLFSLPGPHSSLLFSLESPLALQLPSAGCSALVLESLSRPCRALCAGAR